jgi:hypothetical protein
MWGNRGQSFPGNLFDGSIKEDPQMPGRPRITLPGVPLHLIQRGNNRQACFFADDDYRAYLGWLEEYAQGRRVTPGKSGRPRKRKEPESLEWFGEDWRTKTVVCPVFVYYAASVRLLLARVPLPPPTF